MNFALPLVVVLSFVAVGASSLPARQQPQDPEAEQVLTFEAGRLQLSELLDRSADFLGRRYVYDEEELGLPFATMVLSRPLSMNRESGEEVVEALMYRQSYALVPLDIEEGEWEAIHMGSRRRREIAAAAVSMSVADVLQRRNRKLIVQCSVELQSLEAYPVYRSLRVMITMADPSPGGDLGVMVSVDPGSAKAVRLRGPADRIVPVIDLLTELDAIAASPGEEGVIEPAGLPVAGVDATEKSLVFEAGRLELRELVERSAELLGRQHLFNEADFNREGMHLELEETLTLTPDSCEEIVEGLLFTKDFALVPLNRDRGLWDLVYMGGVRRNEVAASALAMAPAEVLQRRNRKLVVRCIVGLRNLDPGIAAKELRPIQEARSGISPVFLLAAPVEQVGSLVLSGHADRVAMAIDRVAELDAAAAEGDDDAHPPSEGE